MKCTKHVSIGQLLEDQTSQERMRLWREARFQVNMYKTHQGRTTFGSWDVEKWHATVARSAFASQNVQNTFCETKKRVQTFHETARASTWNVAKNKRQLQAPKVRGGNMAEIDCN